MVSARIYIRRIHSLLSGIRPRNHDKNPGGSSEHTSSEVQLRGNSISFSFFSDFYMQSNHTILFTKSQELIAKYIRRFYFIYKMDPILISDQQKKEDAHPGESSAKREMTLDRRL